MNLTFYKNLTTIKVLNILNTLLSAIVLVTFLTVIIIGSYWLLEQDPLYVSTVNGEPNVSLCTDGSFKFTRHTRTNKYLDVRVSPKMVSVQDSKVIYELPLKVYSGNARQDTIVTYRQELPTNFPDGEYVYVPTLTYDINPLKRNFSKVGPPQRVIVSCDKIPVTVITNQK